MLPFDAKFSSDFYSPQIQSAAALPFHPPPMEVFTGDNGLPSDVVLFPETHLSPFSLPTADAFCDQHKISTDHHHFLPPQPPQKLRPIRCNGRSFSECCSSDGPLDPKPLRWQPEAGLDNTETDCAGFIPPKSSTLGLSFKECQTEAALSSSSDESDKLQEAMKESINKKRKRKRKSRKKLKLFIKSMVKTVMEKQEEMHRQLMEILEKKENERIMREEAWKQQETERAKRDERERAQEVSRSRALISFIQNALGQEIHIPNPLDADKQGENQNDFKGDTVCDPNNNVEEFECDSSIKRWPKSEVQALITVRAALNHKFNGKGTKGSLWEEVAGGLCGMGYNRTPKKCKEKWENINKYYRRTMEKGKEKEKEKESGGKSRAWTYFRELEMLYKNGFISGNSQDEDQSMKELQ